MSNKYELKGIRVNIDNDQYFVYKKEGSTASFKPVSMHYNKLDTLKQIATLLNLNVHIEEAYYNETI